MFHKSLSAVAATTLLVAACNPPPPVPPTGFQPYGPGPVDPYGQAVDPQGQPAGQGTFGDGQATMNPYGQPGPTAPAPQPAPTRPGDYPTATRTANPNQVISPYEPFNVIDVEGFRSGQLARDPSNRKIFRVP